MPATLSADDYALLSPLQHERLRSYFPAELQDATLMTRADATFVVSCDWEAIALLNEDWDCFAHFAYLITGCESTTFYVEGVSVLTQLRAIQLQETVSKRTAAMVTATAEKTTKAAAKEAMQPTEPFKMEPPKRTIAGVIQELIDLVADSAIAKIEAKAHTRNGSSAPEQAGDPDSPTSYLPSTPAKLPKVRLQGIFTPTKSNWTQAAKRYLKAVDPTGDAAKALGAIVWQSPTGKAHIERALREYPADDREVSREKLYKGFLKIAAERGLSVGSDAS